MIVRHLTTGEYLSEIRIARRVRQPVSNVALIQNRPHDSQFGGGRAGDGFTKNLMYWIMADDPVCGGFAPPGVVPVEGQRHCQLAYRLRSKCSVFKSHTEIKVGGSSLYENGKPRNFVKIGKYLIAQEAPVPAAIVIKHVNVHVIPVVKIG